MIRLRVAAAAAVLASGAAPAAMATTFADGVAGLQKFGCAVAQSHAGARTLVTVTCDQAQIIQELPVLQATGLMNPDITQTQVNAEPGMIGEGFLMQAVAAVIHPLYQSTNAQATSWDAGLNVADDYGHMRRHSVFTFDFSRALDQRINWENFGTANLLKVAPHFRLTPWGMRAANGSE